MCGIFASISRRGCLPAPETLTRRLRNRGPDHLGSIERRIGSNDDGKCELSVTFTSTVLALRGDGITQQPMVHNGTGDLLCWNGEAWSLDGGLVAGNDGIAILSLLKATESRDAVLDVFRSIQGPFAFIYWDGRKDGHLYFGRDRLGRRSLLAQADRENFLLASIADPPDSSWKEVEADGLYVLNLETLSDPALGTMALSSATRHDWLPANPGEYVSRVPQSDAAFGVLTAWSTTTKTSNVGVFNMMLPLEHIPLNSSSGSVQALRHQLVASLSRRVQKVPRPPLAREHSDTRIAVLFSGGLDCTVLARLSSDLVPSSQCIDLINVAFENPRVVAARARNPTNARGRDAPDAPSNLDIYESCPDRMTGRKSFRELVAACPGRKWRFVAVNVPYAEALAHRQEVVSLMHPHNTEMDLSIAFALYFAARGEGRSQTSPETQPDSYTTQARVLLSGLGADELFGGYARHAAAFSRDGYPGLLAEIKLDVGRIGKRNLGRDDRVMSHWGREVRFPYLDEEFFRWAIERPVWEKCDFESPKTDADVEPDKKVLRLLAEELGMKTVAREKKRAIQFGSRTAKMESGKTKGTTVISG